MYVTSCGISASHAVRSRGYLIAGNYLLLPRRRRFALCFPCPVIYSLGIKGPNQRLLPPKTGNKNRRGRWQYHRTRRDTVLRPLKSCSGGLCRVILGFRVLEDWSRLGRRNAQSMSARTYKLYHPSGKGTIGSASQNDRRLECPGRQPLLFALSMADGQLPSHCQLH
jgi:hypothetical protein